MQQTAPAWQRITTEEIGTVTVVSFVDINILRDEYIDALGKELLFLVRELGRKNVLLNFSNVTYCAPFCSGEAHQPGQILPGRRRQIGDVQYSR